VRDIPVTDSATYIASPDKHITGYQLEMKEDVQNVSVINNSVEQDEEVLGGKDKTELFKSSLSEKNKRGMRRRSTRNVRRRIDRLDETCLMHEEITGLREDHSIDDLSESQRTSDHTDKFYETISTDAESVFLLPVRKIYFLRINKYYCFKLYLIELFIIVFAAVMIGLLILQICGVCFIYLLIFTLFGHLSAVLLKGIIITLYFHEQNI